MIRLCVVKLIQIMLFVENHVIGSNIVVGTIIFNIEAGLSCECNLDHMYWRLRLVGQGLLLFRKQQILVG